jgi:hypothetical protein
MMFWALLNSSMLTTLIFKCLGDAFLSSSSTGSYTGVDTYASFLNSSLGCFLALTRARLSALAFKTQALMFLVISKSS